MKYLILALTLISLSCNTPNGDVIPDGQEQVAIVAGQPVYEQYVKVHPSWSQSIYYGLRSGIAWGGIVGLAGLGGFITILVLMIRRGFVTKVRDIIILGAFAAAAMVGLWSVGGEIHTDNDIRIKKDYYESFKGDLPAMWEDLYQSGRIKGTIPK